MKKILLTFSLVFSLSLVIHSFATNGDTIIVRPHNRTHINWYGNFDRWAVFPDASKKSQRIWLKYTIGCPDGMNCSGWDYTTQVFAQKRTGLKDSALQQAPSFTVDGSEKDSIRFAYTQTYTYQYNSTTKTTDSTANPIIKIVRFLDNTKPTIATDTLSVYNASYYNYIYDSLGVKSDSLFVASDTIYRLTKTPYYNVFDQIDPFELMRVITPYASDKNSSWSNEFWADVTDFSSILKDSMEIRVFFGGYQDGFTVTLDFIFIEGIPAREAYKITNLWNGSFPYGDNNNSIENYLTAKDINIDAQSSSAKLRIIPTGHGSDQGENCAEFCSKFYEIKLNNTVKFKESIWNDQCGSNPHFPQTGTWIYNRANWCPGSMVKVFEHELGSNIQAGNAYSLNMDMEYYSAVNPSYTSYIIGSQLVQYKQNAYSFDAAIDEIRAPSKEFRYSRFNPICDNARIAVKNLGSTTITTLSLSYQIADGNVQTYTWNGSLEFDAITEITLPSINWANSSGINQFKVWITQVNGQTDENPFNNIKISSFEFPMVFPNTFVIETRTNLAPEENSYTIKNIYGGILKTRTFDKASSVIRDTFNLPDGCYSLDFIDNGGDGLSFWNSASQGSGSLRIVKTPVSLGVLKTFGSDFGNFINFNFRVGTPVGISEVSTDASSIFIYPQPANNSVTLQSHKMHITKAEIISLDGRVLKTVNKSELVNNELNVTELNTGIYLLTIDGENGEHVVKKLSIIK